jgi:uncharacterized heparinase superfamily protein
VSCDGRRLFLGCGWSPAPGADASLRGPLGGSCVALGDAWPGAAPSRGAPGAGPTVRAERQQTGEQTWLDLVHDGWKAVSCLRRLHLAAVTGELRGEEVLTPAGDPEKAARAFAVRFILAPEVAAQVAVDARSVLLRPAGGRGWRLRSDAPLSLEAASVFEAGEPRAAQALVLSGVAPPGEVARVRWKLAPDER